MLRCFMDTAIDKNSRCGKCCIYCEDKATCEYTCEYIKQGKTENEISGICVYAYEE